MMSGQCKPGESCEECSEDDSDEGGECAGTMTATPRDEPTVMMHPMHRPGCVGWSGEHTRAICKSCRMPTGPCIYEGLGCGAMYPGATCDGTCDVEIERNECLEPAGTASDTRSAWSRAPSPETQRARAADGWLLAGTEDSAAREEARAAAIARRGQGSFHHSGARQGEAEGSVRARDAARGHTVQCRRCGMLMHRSWIKAATTRADKMAVREGRLEAIPPPHERAYVGTEGCGSPTCTAHPRLPQFVTRQRDRLHDLREGRRTLVDWPRHLADKVVWEADESRCMQAIAHVTGRLREIGGGISARAVHVPPPRHRLVVMPPGCPMHGCPGAGERTESTHMIACLECGHHWQSSWWWTYMGTELYNTSTWPRSPRALTKPATVDERRIAAADHARLYEEGIEPNPGPPKKAAPTHAALCPTDDEDHRGHAVWATGGKGRYYYTCTHPDCRNAKFSQIAPQLVPSGGDREPQWVRGRAPSDMLGGAPQPKKQERCAHLASCPDGHKGEAVTAGSAAGEDRQTYICRNPACTGARFTQRAPGRLPPGEDRQARWTKKGAPANMRAKNQPPRVAGVAQTQQPVTAPDACVASTPAAPPTLPARGQCLGDDTYGYGNLRGMSHPDAWNAYLDIVLREGSAHSFVETHWTALTANKFIGDMSDSGRGRLYSTIVSGEGRGTGCALLLRSDVPMDPTERKVFQSEDGKALAIHATWHGRLILFLVSHSPHEEKQQARFYRSLLAGLQRAYSSLDPSHEDYSPTGSIPVARAVIWAADHNMIMDAKLDSLPAHTAATRPKAARARRALRAYLGGTADAYRHMHPEGRAISRRTADYSHRIDAVEVSPSLMEGRAAFATCAYIQPQDRIVFQPKAKDKKPDARISDHHAISLTYRTTSIPKPKHTPTFANEMMDTEAGKAAMRKELEEALLDDRHATPEERQSAIAEAWMHASLQHRRGLQKDVRLRIAAAHRKLVHLKKHHAGASSVAQRKRASEEIDRATTSWHTALYERQQITKRRRGDDTLRAQRETCGDVHTKSAPRLMATPVTSIDGWKTAADGTRTAYTATSNEEIHTAFLEYWQPIQQMEHDDKASAEASNEVLGRIRRRMAHRLTPDEKDALKMTSVLTAANIREAIHRVKKHTTPGADGIPIEPYDALRDDDGMVNHLVELYDKVQRDGRMTVNMRESTTTMIYKGKGAPSDPANYRPVAVTAIEYRILATALAQRLAEVIPKLIGQSQIGFMLDRVIDENIDLMEEALRYANHEGRERGGAVAILDNAHAFDMVAWPFVWRTLDAFGLPPCFVAMLQTMTGEVTTRLRVNGVLGPQIEQKSGIKQGCPCSSLVYLFVMEVVLTMIRDNPDIRGMQIPNEEGDDRDGHRVTISGPYANAL